MRIKVLSRCHGIGPTLPGVLLPSDDPVEVPDSEGVALLRRYPDAIVRVEVAPPVARSEEGPPADRAKRKPPAKRAKKAPAKKRTTRKKA